MTFRLIHISDPHLGPLPHVRARELISKRITGYINWRRSRAGAMHGATLARLTSAIGDTEHDHIAVTGDLTNLALQAELRAAAIWLGTLGPPQQVSVIPGNHDAYVPGALDNAFEAWAPWMTGDDGTAPRSNAAFPFVRTRGPVAIIGLSSAIATPAFVAAGRIEKDQTDRLAQALARTGEKGLFRVVLIHHPPVRRATVPRKRLYGIGLFQDVIAEHGAELVLHGHTHLPQRHRIPGPAGQSVPVIGVAAAGQSAGHHHPPGAYNRFSIRRDEGQWHCRLETFSATTETGALELTEDSQLWPVPR